MVLEAFLFKLNSETSSYVISYLESIAVIVLAISGMIKASQKRMDIVGAYSLALLTSFGGGTLRDILLQRRPFFWVEHDYFLIIILFMCIILSYRKSMYTFATRMHKRTNTIDAIGLALFSLSGTIAALARDISFFPATIIGVITGVAGGIARDIVVNEIPAIFRPGGLYAIAAFIGSWVYIFCSWIGLSYIISLLIASILIVALRLISVYFNKTFSNPV